MSVAVTRRFFLFAGATAAATWALRHEFPVERVEAGGKPATPHNVTIVAFSDSGKNEGKQSVPAIVKTDADWEQSLPKDVYQITRQAGTEYPYSGKYWNLHDNGIYRCICCDTALFNSDTKFESHTGWPSFWQPIAKENVKESIDVSLGMQRTEVTCKRCEAHLGHVFDDGPRPTGLRYCMNSLSLKFVKFA